MADRAEPINAILYAQYHLKGGLRNTLIGMGVGLLFVGGACVMSLTLNPDHAGDIGRVGAYLILGLQWLVLGLYGTSRVSAAVRQDVSGGLIESHRLTPASPLSAAVGYVVGPPIQAIAMSALLLAVGLVMALIGHVPIVYWLAANGMTLAFAATVWTLVALIAFTIAHAAVLPIIAIASVASGSLFVILPAMSVLTSPLLGRSVFTNIGRGAPTLPEAFVYALVGQALLGGVMLLAVSRRYRNADTPAFSIRLGLLLLGIWTAVTVVGLVQADLFVPYAFRGDATDTPRLIAGLASSFLVALVPLTSLARRLADTGENRRGSPAGEAACWTLILVCAAVACVPAGLQWLQTVRPLPVRALSTLAVAVSMFLGVTLTLAWRFLAGRAGSVVAFLFILLPNAVPPLLDAALRGDGPPQPNYSAIIGFSPLGSLLMLWGRDPYDALPGLLGQAAYVLLPLLLYLLRRGRRPAQARGFSVEDGPELTSPPPLPE